MPRSPIISSRSIKSRTRSSPNFAIRSVFDHFFIWSKKIHRFSASFGSGICLILLTFCDCSQPFLAIFFAVCAVGISSGFIPGYNTSVVCIAPRYTATVASFSRFLGQLASVASPYMIGRMFVEGSKEEWQMIFWVMAFILIIPGVLFQLCGSASVQEWALVIPTTLEPPKEDFNEKPPEELDSEETVTCLLHEKGN